jgi:anti-sigma B factor antagonist
MEYFDPKTATVTVEVASPSVAVVVLEGEHDLASVPQVREALESQLVEERRNVVVDLTSTQFIDIAIARVLLGSHKAAQALGRAFVLQFGTRPAVRRLFEVTKFLDQFPYEESREKAVHRASSQESEG